MSDDATTIPLWRAGGRQCSVHMCGEWASEIPLTGIDSRQIMQGPSTSRKAPGKKNLGRCVLTCPLIKYRRCPLYLCTGVHGQDYSAHSSARNFVWPTQCSAAAFAACMRRWCLSRSVRCSSSRGMSGPRAERQWRSSISRRKR